MLCSKWILPKIYCFFPLFFGKFIFYLFLLLLLLAVPKACGSAWAKDWMRATVVACGITTSLTSCATRELSAFSLLNCCFISIFFKNCFCCLSCCLSQFLWNCILGWDLNPHPPSWNHTPAIRNHRTYLGAWCRFSSWCRENSGRGQEIGKKWFISRGARERDKGAGRRVPSRELRELQLYSQRKSGGGRSPSSPLSLPSLTPPACQLREFLTLYAPTRTVTVLWEWVKRW